MKTHLFGLYFVVLATISMSMIEADAQPSRTSHSSPTYPFPGGTVTPKVQQPSELADLLGVLSWKLDVKIEKPTTDLVGVLEVKENNKPKQELLRFVVSSHSAEDKGHIDLWIAIRPISEELGEASKLSLLARAKGLPNRPVVIPNPFQGANEYRWDLARVQSSPPGELLLLHTNSIYSDPASEFFGKKRMVDLFLTLSAQAHTVKEVETTAPPR